MSETQNIKYSKPMTKQKLLEHLQDIEWDNFEVKIAKTDIPKDNIQMVSSALSNVRSQPKFGNRCDMCFGCVYNCPQKALQPTWGAFQIDKNGYDIRLMYQNSIKRL